MLKVPRAVNSSQHRGTDRETGKERGYTTSALKTFSTRPRKVVMLACTTSSPRASRACISLTNTPGRFSQKILRLKRRPSILFTSTCSNRTLELQSLHHSEVEASCYKFLAGSWVLLDLKPMESFSKFAINKMENSSALITTSLRVGTAFSSLARYLESDESLPAWVEGARPIFCQGHQQ